MPRACCESCRGWTSSMPVKSAAQFRLMQAAAHGKLKGDGPSPSVAKEFLSKTSHAKKSKMARMGRPGKLSGRGSSR